MNRITSAARNNPIWFASTLLVVVAVIVAAIWVIQSRTQDEQKPTDVLLRIDGTDVTRAQYEQFRDELYGGRSASEIDASDREAIEMNAIHSYLAQADRRRLAEKLGINITQQQIDEEIRSRLPRNCQDVDLCPVSPASYRISVETEMIEYELLKHYNADEDYEPTAQEIAEAFRYSDLADTGQSLLNPEVIEIVKNIVRTNNSDDWLAAHKESYQAVVKTASAPTGELASSLNKLKQPDAAIPPLPFDPSPTYEDGVLPDLDQLREERAG